MEYLVANLSGKVLRKKFQGRDYYVVPLSMIVPGVLNGSKGPLLYPLDEISKNPADWNGMPIVAPIHPVVNGTPVSARQPEVIEKFGIGTVFNATVAGKLVAEGWIDIDRARLIEPRVVNLLEAGQSIELSTGLEAPSDNVPGVHNNTNYAGTARNYKPDHLAVLLDAKGACSLTDGCGVLVNSAEQTEQLSLLQKIANKLGLHKEPPTMSGKLSVDGRKKLIDNLVTNCGCSTKVWNEDDRKTLENFSDDKLTALDEGRKLTANASAAPAKEPILIEGRKYTFNKDKGQYEPEAAATVIVEKEGKKYSLNLATNQFTEIKGEAPTITNAPPKTNKDWLDQAPPDIRSVVENAMRQEGQERIRLTEQVLTNNKTGMTKEQLVKLPLDNDPEKGVIGLRTLASIATNGKQAEANDDPLTQILSNYLGANGAPPVMNAASAAADARDILPIPSMSFAPPESKQRTA